MFYNVQESVIENGFPSSHWNIFDKSSFKINFLEIVLKTFEYFLIDIQEFDHSFSNPNFYQASSVASFVVIL